MRLLRSLKGAGRNHDHGRARNGNGVRLGTECLPDKTSSLGCQLVIEHSVTADLPDGQPCPPWIERDIVWHIVRRSNGRTLWRRLFLSRQGSTRSYDQQTSSSSPAIDRRTSRGITHARNEDTAMDMKKYASKGFVNLEYIEEHGALDGIIEHVEIGQFDKPTITLSTGHKFSLNKTNVGILCVEIGEDSDTWLGQPIRLDIGKIKFKGTPQTAVVIEPLISNEGEEAKPKPGKPRADYDDSIPF